MNVLVAGATGFVGSHLVPVLLARGHRVRCLSRDPRRAAGVLPPSVEIVRGDVHEPSSLQTALSGIDVAYYLVHSMEDSEFEFEERDRSAARNFAAAAEVAGLRRIVFLGGLGDEAAHLSAHLRSRHEVGNLLRSGATPVTEMRAGLIIGPGSASYTMLQQLVERLPVMITPRWVETRTQPIAISDVTRYLASALDDASGSDALYEIGGPDVMTYRSMMMRYARARGLTRVMFPVPVLTPRLSSYWVDIITDVPAALARPLIEGLRSEMIVRRDAATREFGPPQIGFEQAIATAEQARSGGRELPLAWLRRLPPHLARFARRRLLPPVLSDEQVRRTFAGRAALWRSAVAVGGRQGYPMLDPLWQVRGWFDRLIGGPGMNRSGPTAGEVQVGDQLDFWEVVELDPGHRLRMRALMKVPGEAELELAVQGNDGDAVLVQTARFRPTGIAGRLYWIALYPMHLMIFSGMATRIVKRAEAFGSMSMSDDRLRRDPSTLLGRWRRRNNVKWLGRILDDAMDWTVLPGFSKIGYSVRERLVPRGKINLAGRSAIVTGANSGIGEAVCVELARLGATVHMLVRSRERGEPALKRISTASGSNTIKLHICDLASLASIREFAAGFLASGAPLDVLINNAGVLPAERSHTDEGFELTFVTNVLGPLLLTALLLPVLRRSASSRVINVSSGGMYASRINLEDLQLQQREFRGTAFYAHTKRAEVILSEEWGRRLARDGVTVHSMHPGWVATAGVASSLPGFNRVMGPLLRSPAAGADTIVWLAGSDEAPRSTGQFWHDRRPRPKHRVPWTRETPEERSRLFATCERLCGLPPGGATGQMEKQESKGD